MAETSLRKSISLRIPTEYLDKSSLDWETALTDQFGGASGCKQTDVLLDKTFGKIEQAGLVVDRQDGYLWISWRFSAEMDFDSPIFWGFSDTILGGEVSLGSWTE
jgi:hypothetical protein